MRKVATLFLLAAYLVAAFLAGCTRVTRSSDPRAPGVTAELRARVEPLENAVAALRPELAALVAAYAPRVWWHGDDPYGPMDPLDFVRASSLWRGGRRLARAGEVKASELAALDPGVGPLYLKYEGPPRPGRAASSAEPMFWKLGGADGRRILIEYWYHAAYSRATSWGLGNHQGDWEGLAAMVELGEGAAGGLTHRPVAFYLAAHDGGAWHRPEELEWEDGHPVVYTALGTHATYARAGSFVTRFLTDVTGRGRAWDAWRNLRALVSEPYFGFRGLWGEARFFRFMSGPLLPGSFGKRLPPAASHDQPWRLF